MKSVLDQSTRDELMARIRRLDKSNTAQWGKMNVHQMMRHCILWDEMVLRNRKYKRGLIGRLFGKMLLTNELKDDRPMRHNNPTIPELIIRETDSDIEKQKSEWLELIGSYSKYNLPDYSFIHPFFGRMTRAQVGFHAYKHSDHHLRQFGC